MAAWAHQREQRGEPFVLEDFFAELNACGVVPISPIHWQMTGSSEQVPRIMR